MRRIVLSLCFLALVACAAAGGLMSGNPNQMISGVTESAGTAMELNQKLAECDKLGAAEVTVDEERAIGGSIAMNWIQQGGGLMVDVPTGNAKALESAKTLAVGTSARNQMSSYLNVVGRNLASRSSRPNIQWTFGVLESDEVNAIAAPGGYVFVTRGLLRRVKDEAALAGVLAHEISHVTRRDAFVIYQRTKVDQCKSLAYGKAGQKEGNALLRQYARDASAINSSLSALSGGALDWNNLANAALVGLFSDEFVHRYLESGYARDQELNADAAGLELAAASGYAPRGFVDFVATLPPGQNVFAHHPSPNDRVASMRLLLGKTRVASMSSASSSPFSPFNQDLSRLPLVPLHDELAAAR